MSAVDIFQYFYGILQELQMNEFYTKHPKSRNLDLIKELRNLEFKLRNFTEGDLRDTVSGHLIVIQSNLSVVVGIVSILERFT